MKRYLARLAERAQTAPPAANPMVRPATAAVVGDPFDVVAPPEPLVPPPSREAPRTASSEPPPSVPRAEPASQSSMRPEPPPSTARTQMSALAARAVDNVRSVIPAAIEPTPARKADSRTEPSPLQVPPPAPAELPARMPMQSTEAAEPGTHEVSDRADRALAAEQRREQRLLLRKADAFMEQLLEGRTTRTPRAEAPPPERERDEPRQPASELRPPSEPLPRLQPARPAMPQASEPAPEPPSLVIGRLTVDIIPAAPALAPPRPRVIVIRGAQAGRSRLPSSRRFGLG
jgi:hypothetical protein